MMWKSSITGMEKSSLSVFCDWLRHPVVEVRLSDSAEVDALRSAVAKAEHEASKARFLYAQEAARCLRYEDFLRSQGIDFTRLK